MKQISCILLIVFFSAFILQGTPAIAAPLFAGDAIPSIQTYSLEGIQVEFQAPKDKIMFVLFWDTHSWRADRTAVWALDVYNRYHADGLEMLGVCTDSLEDEVMEFSERWRIPWPQVPNAEPDGLKRTEQFGVVKTPANLLIDSNGAILARDLKEDELIDALNRRLATEKTTANISSPEVAPSKRDWGPEQAVGEPDTPEAGDYASAWASMTADDRDEWLVLQYENAVRPKAVIVHENHNPGAVCKIAAFDKNGAEFTVWSGIDPASPSEKSGVSQIPIHADFPIDAIKIYLDSQNHPGCNEIDAVALVDESGQVQWAVDASASTSFADGIQFNSEDKGYLYPTERTLTSIKQLDRYEDAANEMARAAKQEGPRQLRSYRYHLKAFIDGTSVLAIHRNTARWYRPQPALENLQQENIFPTYINGAEWYPTWTSSNASGWSGIQTTLTQPLPTQAVQVSLKNPKVEATNCGCEMNEDTFGFSGTIGQAPKGAIYILQQPTAENGYVLAIAFDDFGLGGSNIYDCYINVRVAEQEMTGALAHNLR